jgi:hypothetical protein
VISLVHPTTDRSEQLRQTVAVGKAACQVPIASCGVLQVPKIFQRIFLPAAKPFDRDRFIYGCVIFEFPPFLQATGAEFAEEMVRRRGNFLASPDAIGRACALKVESVDASPL